MADSVQERTSPEETRGSGSEELRQLRIVQYITQRRVSDPTFEKILEGQIKLRGENGFEYENYFTVGLKEIFTTLVNKFDPQFKEAIKRSYSKDELVKYFDHFANLEMFQTRLKEQIALEALAEHSPTLVPEDSEKNPSQAEKEAFKKELAKEKRGRTDSEFVSARNQGIEIQEPEGDIWIDREKGFEQAMKTGAKPSQGVSQSPEEPFPEIKPSTRQRLRLATRNFHLGGPLAGAAQKLWLPVRSQLEKHLWTRVVPAAVVGAVGEVALGPAGAAAGLAVGYLGGQAAFEDRDSGGIGSASGGG